MVWNYAWTLGSLTLANVCDAVRVENEGGGFFNDPGVLIPGREGIQFDAEAPLAPMQLTLKTVLRYTNSSGAITHSDGEAGHVYENLSSIKNQFNSGLVALGRSAPDAGSVRAMCKLTGQPIPGDTRHSFLWFLTVPSGSWQDAAESSSTGAPATGVITTGDREIFDPRVSLASAGTRTVTKADGTVYTIVAAAGPTYPVVIDVGASTATATGGADALGSITFDHEHWFRFSANHTHVITGGSATWFWRDRWA